MVDDELLPHQGGAVVGVISGLPWASSLHTREFRAFHAAFQEWTGQRPGWLNPCPGTSPLRRGVYLMEVITAYLG